jgi:MYXO-CTERM domain-containing protein
MFMQHTALGRSKWFVCLIGAGLWVGGCGQPGMPGEDEEGAVQALADEEPGEPPADPSDPADPPTLAVVGGETSAVCGVPMTAKIPGCTATLVSPTILLTARHCNPRAGMQVQFGEKAPFAFSVRATKCVSDRTSDAAYCVLPADERLARIPTVPVLHGCEYTKFMKAGAKVLGVGFGDTRGTGPARTKLEVEVPVARVRETFIDVGDRTHDLCFGDSGGGAYIHLTDGDKDWGWRMIGTVTGTARVPGGAPCGGTNYTTVLRHIRLIEMNEQIDITPCTDANGAFTPGPECQGFLTDIQTGGGAWPACEYGPRTTLAIDSCDAGPGTSAPPGAMPPPVVTPPVVTPPPATPPPAPPPAGNPPIDPPPATAPPPAPTPAPTAPPPAPTPPPATGGLAPGAPPAGTPGNGLTPGVPAAGADQKIVDAGFGCQVGGASAPAALALPLVFLALLGVRRRRSR